MVNMPFDLEHFIMYTFSGDILTFLAIAFITISVMAAYFKMPNIIAVAMFFLFGLIFQAYMEVQALLVLMSIGLAFYIAISMGRAWR